VTVEPVVYEGGVIFSAEILQPGDQEIEQYGFVRSDSPDFWFGTGVCIRYKNRNLYKNRIL
jgi:hypothetical protein